MTSNPYADVQKLRIGLALSGGGVRAIAFHSGVLKYLAEENLLGKVEHVSTVSGGSLLLGLVFRLSGNRWPDSEEYLNNVLPSIKVTLQKIPLHRPFIDCVTNLLNLRFFANRSGIVANTAKSRWKIVEALSTLPETPVWTINTTCAESGKRFRFKKNVMGDYSIGYAPARDFKIADAIAASAAVPGALGAFMIKTSQFQWSRTTEWNDRNSIVPTQPSTALHLYDGGVYDNLGTETFFEVGQQILKADQDPAIDFLMVSDAGAPFKFEDSALKFNPLRFNRIADILMSQCRSIRVRSFVNFIKKNPDKGMYLQIGARPDHLFSQARKKKQEQCGCELDEMQNAQVWLTKEKILVASAYRTNLKSVAPKDFELLCEHGYQTAKLNARLFHPVLRS